MDWVGGVLDATCDSGSLLARELPSPVAGNVDCGCSRPPALVTYSPSIGTLPPDLEPGGSQFSPGRGVNSLAVSSPRHVAIIGIYTTGINHILQYKNRHLADPGMA